MRGIGDRWLAGERVEGITFAHHDQVRIARGPHAGSTGTVALLLSTAPEPTYLVSLGAAGDARARQSELEAVAPGTSPARDDTRPR